tara:strand:- start:346 stop:519 length:174 start_codon:yes stop_codon:yes gene_type:complete
MKQEETIFNKNTLWESQSPSFNFELDKDQLLAKALEVGFVVEIGADQYQMNNNYGEE